MATRSKTRTEFSVRRPQLLPGGDDRAFRQLIQDMLGVAARMESLRERLGGMIGISGPQYSILISVQHLNRLQGGITVKGLAAHLHVSGTYVTAEAGKLAKAGLLKKIANPHDARSVHLALTAKGANLLRRLLPRLQDANDTVFAKFERPTFQSFCGGMHGLIATLDRALVMTATRGLDRS